jgi:hypothetical protein
MSKPDYRHQAKRYETALIQSFDEPKIRPQEIVFHAKVENSLLKVLVDGKWRIIRAWRSKRQPHDCSNVKRIVEQFIRSNTNTRYEDKKLYIQF